MCRHAPCNKLHLVVQKFHFRRNLKSFPGFRNSHKKAGNHQNCSTTRDGRRAVNVKLSFVRELSIILLFEICVALWSRADFRALKMISYGLDRTYLGVGPTWPEQNQYQRPRIITAPTRPPDLKCGHTYSNYTMIELFRASALKVHAYSS